VLVVFVGLPGSGKTTLARRVAARLGAAHLRIDAIEAAVVRSGLAEPPLGPVGYTVAHEVASSCLLVGTPVVVDAVSAVPEARMGWRTLAATSGVPLRVVEVAMTDSAEHRRRVEARRSDLAGLVVPTWAQVLSLEYEPWDVERDGPRLLVTNNGALDEPLGQVIAYLSTI
jgi:predicted kinase